MYPYFFSHYRKNSFTLLEVVKWISPLKRDAPCSLRGESVSSQAQKLCAFRPLKYFPSTINTPKFFVRSLKPTQKMAKSLRSNRIQKNKSKLRSRVFGPVEEARTQRLSQRLAEIAAASQPPPEPKRKAAKAKDDIAEEDAMAEDEPAEETMRDEERDGEEPSKDEVDAAEAMDIDGARPKRKPRSNKEKRAALKARHRKVKNMVAFSGEEERSEEEGPEDMIEAGISSGHHG